MTAQVSISLNGVDNIGKTTQLAWLSRALPAAHVVGTVDAWEPRWSEVASGDFGHWWFVESTTEEHVRLMLGSHVRRRAGSGDLALEDRGLPMLMATCAATCAIKEHLAPPEAMQRVAAIAATLPTAVPRHELHVLLRRSSDPDAEAAEAVWRDARPADDRYTAYQKVLARVLALQVGQGGYDVVLDDLDDAPILDVQAQIREALNAIDIAVPALPGSVLRRLWVLGGLSESGKSTVAELLREEHGVTRLKIGYLLDVAALRAGVHDPYDSWSEEEQAERLTDEILRFAEATKASAISVESAHSFASTAHLKRIWGDRCQIVYVEASPALRFARSVEPDKSIRHRDSIKRERGAHMVVDIADHVIDNGGTLANLTFRTHRLASTMDLKRAMPTATLPSSNVTWLRRAVEQLRDEHVALILATGSTGSTYWRERWSDLDLLVVRDTLPVDWLRERLRTLPLAGDVKVAVSAFTRNDIEALRVPPRVLHSLRRAVTGDGVLYRRQDYAMPVPHAGYGDRASRGDLGVVLMITRRLLAAPVVDVRAAYKHLVLLAKIMLIADGVTINEPDEVLAVFHEGHPRAGGEPVRLSPLLGDHPGAQAAVTDAVAHMLTYIDSCDTWGDAQ